jgi:hypothetical protein
VARRTGVRRVITQRRDVHLGPAHGSGFSLSGIAIESP